MEAKELRIGNYVFDTIMEEKTEVTEADIRVCAIEADVYEPIRLTEEWLNRFGINYRGVNDENEVIYSDSIDEVWFILEDNEFYLYEYGIKIQYIHQLQNLYFALTGKELILND